MLRPFWRAKAKDAPGAQQMLGSTPVSVEPGDSRVLSTSVEHKIAPVTADVGMKKLEAGQEHALGVFHEGLRNRCENAKHSLDALRSAADEVNGIFAEFATIATELHATRKALVEAETEMQALRKSNDEMRIGYTNLQGDLLRVQTLHDDAASERNLLTQARDELEVAYRTVLVKAKESEGQVTTLEMNLSNAQHEINDLTRKLEDISDVSAKAETQLGDLREARKLLEANLEFESSEKARYAALHDEANERANALRKSLSAANDENTNARERILELEQRQTEMMAEREALFSAVQSERMIRESETRNFEVKLEAVSSRARLAEHMLNKIRDDKSAAQRDQTVLTDTNRKLSRLEVELATMRTDFAETSKRNRELENEEAVLRARLEDMELKLRDRQRASEQASEKIRTLQEALEATQMRQATHTMQITDQMKKVVEQFERERADRIYLEGALNTARRDRAHLQGLLLAIKNGSADANALSAEGLSMVAKVPTGQVAEMRNFATRDGQSEG